MIGGETEDGEAIGREATGGARLCVNDFNIVGDGAVRSGAIRRYHAIIETLLAHGAPLGGVGFQGHFWSEIVTPPERVWEVIDDFAQHGLPLRVTEYDLTSHDDAFHARYLEDFLTAWFAHPATDGFFIWGFWSRAHWRPDAAMFRADWSERPAVAVWRDWVWRRWWTELSETVEEQAEPTTMRVFHGQHRVKVRAADGRAVERDVVVGPEGLEIELRLP